MKCALWLNKRKIRHASEIPDNLDMAPQASLASLRGYFLAGSLSEWLWENGGERYAKRLDKLSPDDPALNEKLAAIFAGKSNINKADFGSALSSAPSERIQAQAPSPAPSSFPSSFAPRNSFRFTEFGSGSFSYEALTSFGELWELLRKFGLFGSFNLTSFTSFGGLWKFHEWEWEWLLGLYGGSGSFVTTSFSSFAGFGKGFGSFDILGNIFGLFNKNLGSFELRRLLENLALDEYDRIMFETLMLCPLDRFGYGIHNI